ncbi:MAG TPA: hypothetical protein VKF17_15920 [Isosphaeraceae bacterium]|nr:hypothetical protein [Isosphaeraceae bacterium]
MTDALLWHSNDDRYRGVKTVRGCRALPCDLSRASAIDCMPELNVLCPIGDYSPQSDQPLMKHVVVEITPSRAPSREGT